MVNPFKYQYNIRMFVDPLLGWAKNRLYSVVSFEIISSHYVGLNNESTCNTHLRKFILLQWYKMIAAILCD